MREQRVGPALSCAPAQGPQRRQTGAGSASVSYSPAPERAASRTIILYLQIQVRRRTAKLEAF